jgi:hypothetical protein
VIASTPFLLAAGIGGIHAYDMSLVDPPRGWPSFVATVVPVVTTVQSAGSREGLVVGAGINSGDLQCGSLSWPFQTSRDCFDLGAATDVYALDDMSGTVEALTLGPGGTAFVAVGQSSAPPEYLPLQRHLFRLRDSDGDGSLDVDYHPPAEPGEFQDPVILGSVDEVGRARRLVLAGNLLVRTTETRNPVPAQVHLHSARAPERFATFDAPDIVYDVAVAGQYLLLAEGAEGLVVARVTCR